MTDDPRVQELLHRLVDSQATPEEACASCPEMLPVVRKQWRQMRRLRADLDVLFPPPDAPSTKVDALSPPPPEPAAQPPDEATALPQIPGYAVEAVLGRGGMGVVYQARHLRLNRPVALKMLLGGTHAGPRELERFLREAEAVAGLRHENIVRVYDVGDHEARQYFTMEYVEGGTLAQKLAGAPQPAGAAARLVATVAGAMQAAHACGIIHRDLKPANVLLTADGTPKVSDFGLARRLEGGAGLTQSGVAMGTPSYMAPEQACGQTRAFGPALDVYGLGAILYELLTGRPPFRAETPAATLQEVITRDPVPPTRLNSTVPRELETICLKCLQKSPSRRYASAQDLADDLHRFQDGKPVLARPVGLFERAVKWVRRRPAAALLVGALLVLLVVAAGTAVWVHQQEKDRQAAKAQSKGQARAALETALGRADVLRGQERWKEALVALTDASPQLAEADSPLLEGRLRQAQADYRIADDLESARESYPLLPNGDVDYQQRASEYQTAFDHVGLRIGDDAETVADHIRASAIREQLIAAIEDRAFVALMVNDGPLVERLLRIARSADPGSPWRDRFRDPAVWGKVEQLQDLAAGAFDESPPPLEHQLAILGKLLMRLWDWSHATQLLGEACRRQPRNIWVQREMGSALSHQRFVEAAGYYRVALALRPDNTGALEGLGHALYATNQREEALATYRRVIQLSPKSASVRHCLVNALAQAGYWKDAEAECRSALEIDPAGHLPLFRLAQALREHGRLEEAVPLYRKVTEIAPDFPDAHHFLGTSFVAAARHEDAVKELRKAKELKPNLPVDGQLAWELAALGRLEEAVTVLQTAADSEPANPAFYHEMVKLLRSYETGEEAAEAFKKAAGMNLSMAWEGLAAARLDQGRFAEARAAIRSALALPGSDVAQRARRRQLDLCDSLLAIEADLPAILAGKG
jgi:serine/threonine-protein kinase